MAWKDDLQSTVDTVFDTGLEQRDGRVVPKTEDVQSNQAVKLTATFLYADLAGSARLAALCPWETTAKIIRAYLACATKLIRAYKGEIRSFDGDRVMGVFVGEIPNTFATKCAREIFWTVEHILGPTAHKKFKSVRDNKVTLRQACGIDMGEARAVRAGIRNNADLIWIGKAPSFAAKLSDLREFPYCTFVSSRVYAKLPNNMKIDSGSGNHMWEYKSATVGEQTETIYRSKWTLTP